MTDLPIRGEGWVAVTSPGDRIPSHGTDLLGQRYAYDLLKVDGRRGIHFHPAGTLRGWLISRLPMILGNHVILRSGDVFAGFVHLAPGSVSVTDGQVVRRGEVIGRVGHTGNSTSPHLHFQLMDSPDPLGANGVPCAFRSYEVLREGEWTPVDNGVPRKSERLRAR